MEKRYINESRYKKSTTRKRRDKHTVRGNLKPKSNPKKIVKKKPKKKIRKNTRKSTRENKMMNIIICVVLIIIIAVISRAILKDENEPFIPLPFFTVSNDNVINVGVITTDSLLDSNTNNLILNELNKYSKDMLLEINDDYSLTYKCISSVSKVSNKEYLITKKANSKVTINEIKRTIDNHRSNEQSVYYNKLKNIDSVTILNTNTINIKLKVDEPYFIYNLDIPIDTSGNLTNYVRNNSSTDSILIFDRHEEADKQLPLKIVVTKYKDLYAAAEAYKSQEIDMFATNAENVQNVLGKYEYNISTYSNGQSMFLFGNSESEVFSKQEVRKAIAYSIDRDGIIQEILNSKGSKIDLPYVYDKVKYKYDIYAAENLLLTNGYTKNNKVYSKTEKGVRITLELDLIVNKNDELKINVANKIKNNLGAIGIKVNVEKLTESKLQTRIKKGDYDLLLANVNLNNSPDLSFIKDNMLVTQAIQQAETNVEQSTIDELYKNIILFQNILSEQVATIGIYSDVSYLVYRKDIGVENISYMNLFHDILD